MIYVISDIHGDASAFKRMLEKIHFNQKDLLYVLGDCIDRGADSIEVLKVMSMHDNIIPIIGNHEYMALRCLPKLLEEIKEDNITTTLNQDFLDMVYIWSKNGGQSTINSFKELSREDQQFYISYMKEFQLVEDVVVNQKKYILIHSIPEGFSWDKEYTIEEILFSRPDFKNGMTGDYTYVVGHTPTAVVDQNYYGKILHCPNLIDIDCGAGSKVALGCLCLDTNEEFYVECEK